MPDDTTLTTRPIVHLVGQVQHPEFHGTVELLSTGAELVDPSWDVSPELIVIAQSRPGAIRNHEVQRLQHRAPLAGVVALLGSWCEGESRTGRPWPGVPRLYWYEFPAWWRHQLILRADGRCPDWARPADFGLPRPAIRKELTRRGGQSAIRDRMDGVIMLCAPRRDTREALADVLRDAGYATVWHRFGWPDCEVHGAAAGIWDGGQLDQSEADHLAMFSRKLSRDAAPVIALLDFPRRDRVQQALELGAAAVLGKPWRNEALISTLRAHISHANMMRAA